VESFRWPSVAIIVLTWNQRDLTLECLESLVTVDYPSSRLQIVVVDNGSSDDTAQAIRGSYSNIEVLENGKNLGYAGGNNVGIRHALAQGADYVCILNNDTTAASNFLAALLGACCEHAGVGVVSPLVADMADPARIWALGAAVDQRTGMVTRLYAGDRVSALEPRAPFEVDIASGAAMLVKGAVFERVGLLDEEFYLYFEEADWCLRARQAGYRILAVPSSVIWHHVSATLGQTSPVIDYYMARNQLRFIARHWSGAACLWLLTRTVLRTLLAIAAYTFKSREGQRLPHRNARLLALRDAMRGRWGEMGSDVASECCPAGR
jgi:GT2 family glycosyltransferase